PDGERAEKQHQEDAEQPLSNGGGNRLHIAEAENAGNDGDQQEYNGPFQHRRLLKGGAGTCRLANRRRGAKFHAYRAATVRGSRASQRPASTRARKSPTA